MTPETPSPSVTTVGERRDAIARIIDPEAWTDKRIAFPVVRKSRAFSKADAILSLESPAQVTGEGMTPVAELRGDVKEVTPAMQAAWCEFEPAGQFSESMSFARFNGMLRHAFCSGYAAALPPPSDIEGLREALEAFLKWADRVQTGSAGVDYLNGDDGTGQDGWEDLDSLRNAARTVLGGL